VTTMGLRRERWSYIWISKRGEQKGGRNLRWITWGRKRRGIQEQSHELLLRRERKKVLAEKICFNEQWRRHTDFEIRERGSLFRREREKGLEILHQ